MKHSEKRKLQMAWSNTAFDTVLKTDDDKSKFYAQYNNNIEFLDELVKVFEEKIKASELEADSKDTYDSPTWPYRQADSVGYRRAMREVNYLLNIREKTVEI